MAEPQEVFPSEVNQTEISHREARVDVDALRAVGCILETEYSKISGRSKIALWQDRKAGRGPAWFKLGRVVVYRLVDIQKYFESMLVLPTQPARPRGKVDVAGLVAALRRPQRRVTRPVQVQRKRRVR